MRVMVIVKATKESEAANPPFEIEGAGEMFEAMGKFNEELIKAGIMLAGDGLAQQIREAGPLQRHQADGDRRPLHGDQGAGGRLLGLAGALDGGGGRVGQEVPNPMPGPSDLEIRPFWEAEDFGPEIAAGVNAQREKIAKGGT